MGLYKVSQCKNDDDIIIGTYKTFPVELIESEFTHTEGSEETSTTITDFKGLIFKCKINKKFNCRVVAGRHAYNTDKKMEIIKLEDTESEDEESYVSVDDEDVLNEITSYLAGDLNESIF